MSIFNSFTDDFFSEDMIDSGLFLKDNRPVDVIISTTNDSTDINQNITVTNGQTIFTIKSSDLVGVEEGDIIKINDIDWRIDNLGLDEYGVHNIEVSID